MEMTVDQITAQIHKLVNDQGFLWTSRIEVHPADYALMIVAHSPSD